MHPDCCEGGVRSKRHFSEVQPRGNCFARPAVMFIAEWSGAGLAGQLAGYPPPGFPFEIMEPSRGKESPKRRPLGIYLPGSGESPISGVWIEDGTSIFAMAFCRNLHRIWAGTGRGAPAESQWRMVNIVTSRQPSYFLRKIQLLKLGHGALSALSGAVLNSSASVYLDDICLHLGKSPSPSGENPKWGWQRGISSEPNFF